MVPQFCAGGCCTGVFVAPAVAVGVDSPAPVVAVVPGPPAHVLVSAFVPQAASRNRKSARLSVKKKRPPSLLCIYRRLIFPLPPDQNVSVLSGYPARLSRIRRY